MQFTARIKLSRMFLSKASNIAINCDISIVHAKLLRVCHYSLWMRDRHDCRMVWHTTVWQHL